jgi:hypothetical protein
VNVVALAMYTTGYCTKVQRGAVGTEALYTVGAKAR